MEEQCVKIYGASDDLIELEGDISEEFSAYNDENGKMAFGDGTLLSVEYDSEGCWRINRLKSGTASYSKKEADGGDTENYSDVVTLNGDLGWCLYGTQFRATTPSQTQPST